MDLDSRKEGGFHLFLKCRLLPAQFLWLIMHQSWVCSWWKVALAMARILMLLWQCLLGSEGSAQRSRPVLALWLRSKRGSSHWEQLCTIVLGSIGSLGAFLSVQVGAWCWVRVLSRRGTGSKGCRVGVPNVLAFDGWFRLLRELFLASKIPVKYCKHADSGT